MRGFSMLLGAAATVFMLACETDSPTASDNTLALKRASPAHTSPTLEWVEEVFIDYGRDPAHAGPGPHPETESDRFKLTQGGISWFSGGTVEYKIVGAEGVGGGNTAIETAEQTWDGFITTRLFTRKATPAGTNPCTGLKNTIQWVNIDGAGGVLASASVCRNVVTKAIGGFVITIDNGETWSTNAAAGTFDVENVTSHEFGHVAGLTHVQAPRDGCLTMYFFAGRGEKQKRTLGLGDKLGMKTLYSSGDVAAGACGS